MNGTIALACNATHRARIERMVFRKFGDMEMKKTMIDWGVAAPTRVVSTCRARPARAHGVRTHAK
eukprot:8768452-Pyramimonas_sp.AAC.1